MENIIIQAVGLAITVAAFVAGRYIAPNISKDVASKLNVLAAWAEKFVVAAREFMKSSSGKEKMDQVVKQLGVIAKEAGLNVTEDQLRAIAQSAYEAMKAGQQAAEPPATAKVAPMVVINTQGQPAEGVAVLTDDVPEGALDERSDGKVNAYDRDGKLVGGVDRAAAEQAAVSVSAIKLK